MKFELLTISTMGRGPLKVSSASGSGRMVVSTPGASLRGCRPGMVDIAVAAGAAAGAVVWARAGGDTARQNPNRIAQNAVNRGMMILE